MLQVVQVNNLFEQIDRLRSSQWKEVCGETNETPEPHLTPERKKSQPRSPKTNSRTIGACDSLNSNGSASDRKISSTIIKTVSNFMNENPLNQKGQKPDVLVQINSNSNKTRNGEKLFMKVDELLVNVIYSGDEKPNSTVRQTREPNENVNPPIPSPFSPQIQRDQLHVSFSEDTNVKFDQKSRQAQINEEICTDDSVDSVNYYKDSDNELFPENSLESDISVEKQVQMDTHRFVRPNFSNNQTNFIVNSCIAQELDQHVKINDNVWSFLTDSLKSSSKDKNPSKITPFFDVSKIIRWRNETMNESERPETKRVDPKNLLPRLRAFEKINISMSEMCLIECLRDENMAKKKHNVFNFICSNRIFCRVSMYLYVSGFLSLVMVFFRLNPYNCCLLASNAAK